METDLEFEERSVQSNERDVRIFESIWTESELDHYSPNLLASFDNLFTEPIWLCKMNKGSIDVTADDESLQRSTASHVLQGTQHAITETWNA